MKIQNSKPDFTPIAIILETQTEIKLMHDLIRFLIVFHIGNNDGMGKSIYYCLEEWCSKFSGENIFCANDLQRMLNKIEEETEKRLK